jgi:predicted O-methyltransferase YrrM
MRYVPPAIDGWMNPEELNWLYERACEMDSIVEIGSWMGKSTHALCSGCKGIVYSVDHFMGSPDERATSHKVATERDISIDFFRNVGHFENLRQIRMDSILASKQFESRSIDMVFIDGSHNHYDVLSDLKAWYPIARKIICGHDHSAIQAALKEFGINDEIRVVDSIWNKTI